MRCVPEAKNPRGVRRLIFSLFLSAVLIYAVPTAARAAGVPVIDWIFVSLAFVCLISAIFLLVRYTMTAFQYVVRTKRETEESGLVTAWAGAELNLFALPPDALDFVVFRSQGSRAAVMECVLGLEELEAVYTVRRKKSDGLTRAVLREKYAAEGYVFYDYTITFLPEEVTALVFRDGGKPVGILIEPDERMRAYFEGLLKSFSAEFPESVEPDGQDSDR